MKPVEVKTFRINLGQDEFFEGDDTHKCHCNECNILKLLNDTEREELETIGAFVCSDCINNEMNKEQTK